jgi:ferritin-like metal-binding protein YciE
MTPDSLNDQLVKYLADAHSIEEQALVQMKRAPKIAGEPGLEAIFREHEARDRRARAAHPPAPRSA